MNEVKTHSSCSTEPIELQRIEYAHPVCNTSICPRCGAVVLVSVRPP